MKLSRLSFNINKAVILSLLLHAAFFIVGLSIAAPGIVPLPLGVEVMFGQGGENKPSHTHDTKPAKFKHSVVVKNFDASALKTENALETTAPQSTMEKNSWLTTWNIRQRRHLRTGGRCKWH